LVYKFQTHFLKNQSGQLCFYSNQNRIAFSKKKPKQKLETKEKENKKKKNKKEDPAAHLGRTREPAGPAHPRTSPTQLPLSPSHRQPGPTCHPSPPQSPLSLCF
jgi:hypothetical protein